MGFDGGLDHTRRQPTQVEIHAQYAAEKASAIEGLAARLAPSTPAADCIRAASSALRAGAFDERSSSMDAPGYGASAKRLGKGGQALLLLLAAGAGAPGSLVKKLGAGAGEPELSAAAPHASRGGHAEAAIELIALGASVDAKERDGRTMLHHCAADVKPGHLALMAFLLAEGASPLELEAQLGATPLAWACYSKNPDAAKLLVGSGGLDAFDNRGRTPLGHCSAHGGCAECAQILLARGAHLHAKAGEGKPCAFETAILEGSGAAAAMAPWADFSKRSTDGSTWMELASLPRGYIPAETRQALVDELRAADHAAKEREALAKLLAESDASKPHGRKPSL